MTGDPWRRAKEIFADAREVRGAAREALLRERCGGDASLLAEVRGLLEADAEASGFLVPPTHFPGAVAEGVPADAAVPGAGDLVGGRYLLEERIASGSFGEVFRAVDRMTGARAAVKVLAGGRSLVDEALRREASLLRRARLPGVAALLDDGLEDGYAWIAMALLEGRPFPGREAPVPWEELAPTARSLLETLGSLHRLGVFHGDLKPANVLVDAEGRPHLVDLGVSREREEAEQRLSGGTPAWLAPERFGGGPPDERSDLYSVGVMLYEALAGVPPHDEDRMTRLEASRKAGAAPSLSRAAPGVPAPVASVVDRLLAPDPSHRPASAEAAAAALFPRGPGAPADPLRAAVLEVIDARIPGWTGGALPVEALRPLFAGPDRVFHLREDGAGELHRRTGGERLRVEEELERWMRAGHARAVDGVLSVPREALQRLRAEGEVAAWLRREGTAAPAEPGLLRALAETHPPESEARFFLLCAAGDAAAACSMAGDLGQRLHHQEGRIQESLAVLEEALALGRRTGTMRDADEEDILLSFLRLAKYTGTPATRDRLLYHLERRRTRSARSAAMETVLRALDRMSRGDARGALGMLDALEGEFDPVLDTVLWSARSDAARAGPRGETWVREAMIRTFRWQRRQTARVNRRLARSTLGDLRYREGDFRSSGSLHLREARLNPSSVGRANGLVNAANAFEQVYRLDRAAPLVEEALEILRPLRAPRTEFQAEAEGLAIRYRRGEDGPVDPDLLEAALAAEGFYGASLLLLYAAACAWRRGDPEAATLAGRAAERFRGTRGGWGPEPLSRALSLVAGADPEPGEPQRLAERGAGIPVPGVALQVLGLVGMLRTGAAGRWRERAAACASALDPAHAGFRREVLSPEEALRAVDGDTPENS